MNKAEMLTASQYRHLITDGVMELFKLRVLMICFMARECLLLAKR